MRTIICYSMKWHTIENKMIRKIFLKMMITKIKRINTGNKSIKVSILRTKCTYTKTKRTILINFPISQMNVAQEIMQLSRGQMCVKTKKPKKRGKKRKIVIRLAKEIMKENLTQKDNSQTMKNLMKNRIICFARKGNMYPILRCHKSPVKIHNLKMLL